ALLGRALEPFCSLTDIRTETCAGRIEASDEKLRLHIAPLGGLLVPDRRFPQIGLGSRAMRIKLRQRLDCREVVLARSLAQRRFGLVEILRDAMTVQAQQTDIVERDRIVMLGRAQKQSRGLRWSLGHARALQVHERERNLRSYVVLFGRF